MIEFEDGLVFSHELLEKILSVVTLQQTIIQHLFVFVSSVCVQVQFPVYLLWVYRRPVNSWSTRWCC